jgi:hypothetical protein
VGTILPRSPWFPLVAAWVALALAPSVRAAIGEAAIVSFSGAPGVFPIVSNGAAAPICVDAQDWPGVKRVAVDFQADVERVTGLKPLLSHILPTKEPEIVLIGTIGRSPLIDRLLEGRKLDLAAIRGSWESWLTQVIEHPFPGVGRALVIAGSDKRGAIYGAYDLSEQMGVSPWYWWADVPPRRHAEVFVASGRVVHGPPVVKYRGIFLNDEAPDLTRWVREKFGTAPVRADPPVPAGVANYGRDFYARIFELILRLRGNYLWPAMWSNAFNEDDPINARLADGYGVVMGTSHQEPMLRAQKEWDRRYLATAGAWNFASNPGLLLNFWKEGISRNRGFESIVTLGLRGANDTEMAPGGPAANRALLERIVEAQRGILRQEMNPDLTQVPQLWCLYKEVQEYYDAGMRVPDDVTLLWSDDNWGDLRRLPTEAERRRRGGAGIYYHFDYHGGPRSYQWINTDPLPKIWEQMSLAARYGADRVWIVNVGHLKGYELPTEFFLNMAWNPQRWNGDNLAGFTPQWAARQFGAEKAAEIATVLDRYAKFNGRRKPELLSPGTYSLVNYGEAETVVADYAAVARQAKAIGRVLPPADRDAYTELVEFPAVAGALVNEVYLSAGRNALFARQGRASANEAAAQTRLRFRDFVDLMGYYNRTLAGGRWDHFMDQPVFGYATWRDPPANSLDALKLVAVTPAPVPGLGVAIEGSAASWPGPTDEARLPLFDAVNRQHQYVEVFNRGTGPFAFTVAANEGWIRLDETGGTIGPDTRIGVSIDWDRAPAGRAEGTLVVTGAGSEVRVGVASLRPPGVTRESLRGFVEGQGVVSIEPEHFSRNLDAGPNRWSRIGDYGRTLSGMRAEAPVEASGTTPGRDAPCLEYRIFIFSGGTARVGAIAAPTLSFFPGRDLRVGVSFDDGAPEVVTLARPFRAQEGNLAWEKSVSDNARQGIATLALPTGGAHTLKLWMIDPGVVLQKLVVDLGGLRESYLGPPESLRAGPVDSQPSPTP